MSASSQRPPPPPDPVVVLSGRVSVTSLVFLDSDIILTGHQNGLIQEWSLTKRRATTSWNGHSDTVLWLSPLAFNHQLLLLSQGRDGLVKAWTKGTGDDGSNLWTIIAQVPSAPLIFCNSALINSKSGKLLATPSEETSQINIHKITDSTSSEEEQETVLSTARTPIRILKPTEVKGYGMCMKMCPVIDPPQDAIDGHLLVGYESGAVTLWNALKGEIIHTLRLHEESVMGLTCWSNQATGQTVGLSCSVNNVIQCWKISDDNLITKDNNVSVKNEGFNDIAIRKDGRIFTTGGWDGGGRVFGLKKLRPLAVLTYHKESINCVAFGPNNELVLASKDGYISFWDVFKNS